jgi:hypothetical protein
MAENAGFEVFMLTPDKDYGSWFPIMFLCTAKTYRGLSHGSKEIREKYDC